MANHPDLHYLLDWNYTPEKMQAALESGVDPNERYWKYEENALHVAVRRRRLEAIAPLLKYGVDINAKTKGGKTAYAHAIRRGFTEISDYLENRGADTSLNAADQLAVALVNGNLDAAARLIAENSELVPQMNPEEARILPDLTGRARTDVVRLLLDAGVDVSSRGLDEGTGLHMAAWFGQPDNTRLLIKYQAPLEIRGDLHNMSPLGWVVHGSVYSGSAQSHADDYTEIARILLEAGASLLHPDLPEDKSGAWLLKEVSTGVEAVLRKFGASN
ncbi:MAG: ankyrin repeat domain-containing protein [Saprospiraceae bacterium]|nr:ankyrin repeat domain-containing protein [Saprospiraceae bacterium]